MQSSGFLESWVKQWEVWSQVALCSEKKNRTEFGGKNWRLDSGQDLNLPKHRHNSVEVRREGVRAKTVKGVKSCRIYRNSVACSLPASTPKSAGILAPKTNWSGEGGKKQAEASRKVTNSWMMPVGLVCNPSPLHSYVLLSEYLLMLTHFSDCHFLFPAPRPWCCPQAG